MFRPDTPWQDAKDTEELSVEQMEDYCRHAKAKIAKIAEQVIQRAADRELAIFEKDPYIHTKREHNALVTSQRQRRRQREIQLQVTEKVCTKCDTVRQIEDYYAGRNVCRFCCVTQNMAYAAKKRKQKQKVSK